MTVRPASRTAQAWVSLRADDPEAVSALTVARRSLAAGHSLTAVRRFRLYELRGCLPARDGVEELLHRSRQFYHPQKEQCVVRLDPGEPAPMRAEEQAILVSGRPAERRAAAERWWSQVTGGAIEVREGAVWAVSFEPGVDARAAAAELAVLRDPGRGLFCNPHAQDHRLSGAEVPLPWLMAGRRRKERSTP